MTATPRRTASASAVSRLLGPAPEAGWIRRSHVAGFTVAQVAPDVVQVEWHGPDSQRADAYALLARLLDGPYDVEKTTARHGTHSSYAVDVLRVTPGTPIAAVEGTEATADDVTAPSYIGRAPWETERTAPSYITAAEARASIDNLRAEHGAATVDPATGVITLHVGKDRTERHTLTPSTPEQLAAHRRELMRLAAHWADQARRATEEAARLRGAVDTCHPSQRHHVETRLRTVEDSVQRSHAAAAKAEDAAHALDERTAAQAYAQALSTPPTAATAAAIRDRLTEPTYELQEWDWSTNQWRVVETYDTNGDSRAEGNAYYAYNVHRSTGPHRLLKDGKTALGNDDPNAYYAD